MTTSAGTRDKLRNQKGFTLLEVVIYVAIMTTAIVCLAKQTNPAEAMKDRSTARASSADLYTLLFSQFRAFIFQGHDYCCQVVGDGI